MIIGVVGMLSAGTSSLARMFADQGFTIINLADFLRGRANARNLKLDDDTLYSLGNELRTKFGPTALMTECVNHIEGAPGDYVVHGIFSLAEMECLRSLEDVSIIGVVAPIEVRFARALAREQKAGRDEFCESMEEFAEMENQERAFRSSCRELVDSADILISNDGTLEELKDSARSVLAHLRDGPSSAETSDRR